MYSTTSLETRRRRRARKKLIPFFIFIIGSLWLISIIIGQLWQLGARAAGEIAGVSTKLEEEIHHVIPTPTVSNLGPIVKEALTGTKGSYGIVIQHLKTGESYTFNPHHIYKSASLYKLWVMGTAYEQIREGKLKENEIISRDLQSLLIKFNLATESAQTEEGQDEEKQTESSIITLSVQNALQKMITYSDNNSALLLSERVKLTNIAAYLNKHGFVESKLGTATTEPITTAHDIALFLEKLYKGQLANPEDTNKMLSLLKNQQLNNKLPRYLPQGVTIAHKTGELYYFTHDAGIVYTPKGDYIIVVLSETNSPPQAETRIAEISKAVYNYFINQ